jgi:hypothetical protein
MSGLIARTFDSSLLLKMTKNVPSSEVETDDDPPASCTPTANKRSRVLPSAKSEPSISTGGKTKGGDTAA